jgi:protein-histidine pros-kinase
MGEGDRTLKEVLDLLPDAALMVDADGRVVYAATHTAALFGYAAGELVGRPIETLMPERFRQRHVEERQDINQRGTLEVARSF